ncbi:hypothetical protein [Clostridium botulinum]|uniref:hypothetical protein n=1 Tax=Clostridium botulinum TaxID=1491 RepID=UPI0007741B89|nr:hypothetical protein [Clostridium botulinum]NFE93523.1 hypothetical protein [Clostridium botulinum]NFL38084.1 hypothetical protein [Clostridium botulinum]NFL64428.1 hypothetical protein [Clostridium botulinum]NFN07975.1 hypothetical protein [Clostridium botulinum]NFN24120.1 hypothetical protein [Clostridium botulinum]
MNKLNIDRLKYLSASMQDVIRDLDEIISIYDNQPTIIKKHLEQSFRTSFLQYKELLGNYMSQCLKVISVSVSKITYSDAIELCIKENLLPNHEIILYKTLSKFRNDTAHVYKKPPFIVLLQFYKENRDFLNSIIEKINNVIKKNRNDI